MLETHWLFRKYCSLCYQLFSAHNFCKCNARPWTWGLPWCCHDVAMVLPLKVHTIVRNFFLEYINELVEMVIGEPAGFFMSAFDWLALESGSSGQLRWASSGHFRSAALCVEKTVGRPIVSTIAIRCLFSLYQYCRVPHRLEAKCRTLLKMASPRLLSISSSTERWSSWECYILPTWRTWYFISVDVCQTCHHGTVWGAWSSFLPTLTIHAWEATKLPLPVGNRVGKVQEMCPSVLNSLIGFCLQNAKGRLVEHMMVVVLNTWWFVVLFSF